jgi:hypothetical protein
VEHELAILGIAPPPRGRNLYRAVAWVADRFDIPGLRHVRDISRCQCRSMIGTTARRQDSMRGLKIRCFARPTVSRLIYQNAARDSWRVLSTINDMEEHGRHSKSLEVHHRHVIVYREVYRGVAFDDAQAGPVI